MNTYRVKYICTNCGETLYLDIEKGKRAPVLVYPFNKENRFYTRGYAEAPECGFCGCREYEEGEAIRK